MIDVRLIDANALTRWLESVLSNANPLDRRARAAFSEVLARVKTMLDIDAVPVAHGRWDKPVEHGLPYAANHLGVVCSYCCKWSDNDYNYCPNCGAKMDGGAENGC